MKEKKYIDIKNHNYIYDKIVAIEPSIRYCVGCGRCVATCVAAQKTDFSMRTIIYKIRRGDTLNIKNESKYCQLCVKCFNICPEGVNTRNILLLINKLSKI